MPHQHRPPSDETIALEGLEYAMNTNHERCSINALVDEKLLTIITVVFNSKEYINETISSILDRKSRHIEYLIIDGGSTDGTLEVIEAHSFGIDFFLSEPDLGIYDAMNKAIRYASGRWIVFINSGDIWLQKQDDSFFWGVLRNESNSVILCNTQVSRNDNLTTYIKTPRLPLNKSSFIFGIPACHQGIIYRRSKMMPFDINYKIISDKIHLWQMYCKDHGKDFALFGNVVSNYRLGGFSEANRATYHKEEAKFFSEMFRLGWLGELVAYRYLNLKRRLFVLLTRLRE